MDHYSSEISELHRKIELLTNENRLLAEKSTQFETALREQDAIKSLFTELTESIPGAIYQFQVTEDGANKILYMSKSAEQLFEQPLSVILEFDLILDSVFEEDKPGFMNSIELAISQMLPWFHEYRLLTKSGQVKWVRGTSNPKRMEDGKYIWNGLLIEITKQKKVEAALTLNNLRYRQAQQIGKVGNWEYDIETTHFWGSEQAKEIYGFAPDAESFTTGAVENCIPERERVHQALIDLIESGKEYDLEFQINPINSGQPKYISSKAELIKNEVGQPRKIAGVIQEITKQYQAEQALIKSLKEKEILLHEIHHRVKNNMQIIASLLKLQLNKKDKKDVDEILKENMGRVYSMAAIHESLHQSEKLSEIHFKVYLNKLSQMLSQTYSVDPSKVTFQIDTPKLTLAIDIANPLGLVLNELISNSLKYAFPDDHKGMITIKSSFLDEETIELIVADDGIGLPDGFDWKTTDTLGLKLVQSLVEGQLDGSIDMESKNGTQFTIKFKPKSNYT